MVRLLNMLDGKEYGFNLYLVDVNDVCVMTCYVLGLQTLMIASIPNIIGWLAISFAKVSV